MKPPTILRLYETITQNDLEPRESPRNKRRRRRVTSLTSDSDTPRARDALHDLIAHDEVNSLFCILDQ